MATTMVAITGNTYPVKDSLRALGGKWDADQKAWLVPEPKAEEARKLVAGAVSTRQSKSTYRPTRCKECGAAASRYNKIYRSGICGNCYRDEREEREMGY